MKQETTLKRTSQRKYLFPIVAVFSLFIVCTTVILFTKSAEAGDDTQIFLPAVVTPREFEANLISNSFEEIAHIAHAGDERLFIVQRNGLIRILHDDSITTFLDLGSRVECCSGEEGLFALAFHPDYDTNGYFYVSFVGKEGDDNHLFVERYSVTGNPDVADVNSRAEMFEEPLDSPLHNGGGLAFNPTNGKLYLGVGDDQGSLIAQENSDKGKIIELNVDNYPDVTKDRVAKGFRNPWRLSFDPINGDLFIAEVGDDSWEEVNFMPNGATGLNYGWPCYEGPDVILDCAHHSVQPIYAYPHHPARAVIGGPVYRHSAADQPVYIFGDFATKEIYSLKTVNGVYEPTLEGTLPAEMTFLYSFGTASDGTLYAGGFGGGLYEVYIPGITP